MRTREPKVMTIRARPKSFSRPKRAAHPGAREEQRANIIRGREVKMPNSLTETPSPAAISVKTAGIAVNGTRITAPIIMIPTIKKKVCLLFILFFINLV
jgi:hypothetical protein